jgi:hypothetical protein
VAHELHDGGDQDAAYQGGVDQDGQGDAEPSCRRRLTSEAIRASMATATARAAVVKTRPVRATPWTMAAVAVMILDPGEQQEFVVDGQAEGDAEQQDRPGRNRASALASA